MTPELESHLEYTLEAVYTQLQGGMDTGKGKTVFSLRRWELPPQSGQNHPRTSDVYGTEKTLNSTRGT